jgi:hypothetical protein
MAAAQLGGVYLAAKLPEAPAQARIAHDISFAAGSAFVLTQALLGFLPDAPRNKLYIAPLLPQWLPHLAVHDIRLGKHKLDIRFWREGEDTAYEVIKGDPTLVERCDIARKVAQLRTASDPF